MIETQGKLLFMAFFTLLIGIVLIQPIADDIESVKVGSIRVGNESVTISSGTGTLTNDEVIGLDVCLNSTMTSILINTHCNVTLATGVITVNPNNFTDSLVFANYTYEPDTFVESSVARVLLTQTRLFFAIAILLVGIGFAVAAFKQSGVM